MIDADNVNPGAFQIAGNGVDGLVAQATDSIDIGYQDPVNIGDAWTFTPPSFINWAGGSDPPASSGLVI